MSKHKCINCPWEGDELSKEPVKDKCPVCGDEVESSVQPKEEEKVDFDLNNDGKVDEADRSIAGKLLRSKKGKKK